MVMSVSGIVVVGARQGYVGHWYSSCGRRSGVCGVPVCGLWGTGMTILGISVVGVAWCGSH